LQLLGESFFSFFLDCMTEFFSLIFIYFSVMGIEPYQIRFDTWDGYSDSLSVSLLETGAQQGVRWFWEKAPVQKVSMKYDIVVFSEAEVRQFFLERIFYLLLLIGTSINFTCYHLLYFQLFRRSALVATSSTVAR